MKQKKMLKLCYLMFFYVLSIHPPVYSAQLHMDKIDIVLHSLDGQPAVNLKKSKGIIVVHLWASWCRFCQIEHQRWNAMPKLDGAQYYGVSFRDNETAAKNFLIEYGNPFDRHLYLDQENANKIGARVVPDTMIFEDGKMIYRHKGSLKQAVFNQIMLMQLSKVIEQYKKSAGSHG